MGYISDLRKIVKNAPLIMPCSAGIIIKNDTILLQQRFDNLKWAIHGGSVELGETLEETLIREVKEETNLDVISFEFFKNYSGNDFKVIYPNKDVVYIIDHIYVIHEFSGKEAKQKEEVKELKWFKIDEIPWEDLMEHNKIILKDFIQTKLNKAQEIK